MSKSRFPALVVAIAVAFAFTPSSAGAASAADGEKLYDKKCKLCHPKAAGKHKLGPSLAGIVGKKAASTDFKKYKGLKGKDVVWDDANLDAFLADPKKFVGGKTMVLKLKEADDRANVIEYMKTLK